MSRSWSAQVMQQVFRVMFLGIAGYLLSGYVAAQTNRSDQSQNSQLPPCSQVESGQPCRNLGENDQAQRGVSISNEPTDSPTLIPRDTTGRLGSERKLNRAISPEIREPNEFQDFVTQSLGKKLSIFGYDLFNNVPSTFAPVDQVPVTADYVIGPGDQLLIRAWGQIDVNYRATVDRSGNIYLPKVGTIAVSGIRFQDLQPFLTTETGRIFRNFELTVTLGQLRSIQIFIVGHAKRPGSYTVSSLSTLLNALFASGGPSNTGSLRGVEVKRNGKLVTVFDLYELLLKGDKSKDIVLLPGDVIYIPPVGSMVGLAGSVTVPSIYEIKKGTSLGEIIDFAGGLSVTASGERAILERISDHFIRNMAEFPLDAEGLSRPLQDGDLVRILSLSGKFENAVTLRGNVAVPGRYRWQQGMRIKDLIPNKEVLITREYWLKQNSAAGHEDLTAERLNRNLLATAAQTSSDVDLTENSGDRPQSKLSPALSDENSGDPSHKNPDRQKGTDYLRNEIKRNAPEINWDYAVIQRLNANDLTSSLVPFNLGKAILESDPENNVPLQPGDVVTIFSQTDLKVPIQQQSKYVRLEGEFVKSGIYKVSPGETLRELVARLGGFTPNSYLYGSEFTRESTRVAQQRRLDEFLNRLEQEIDRSSSGKAQSVISPEEAASLKENADNQRKLLQDLRQAKATGRVVLGLRPSEGSPEDLPNLPLEDGDRFFVPSRPATVNVIGAVYNDNSFIYTETKRINDYLKEAGGGTRNADRAHMYLVRANGSVLSRSFGSKLLTNNFESAKVMPGDTIVIPEQLNKTSVLRGLRDWSQVVAQFALGVAALQTLTR